MGVGVWGPLRMRRARGPDQGRKERGATLIEYAFLLSLIAAVVIGATMFVGGRASGKLSFVGDQITRAGTASPSPTIAAAPSLPDQSPGQGNGQGGQGNGQGNGCGGANNDGTDNNGGENNTGCP